jgi:DNA-binding winged helix-turn-helix (wHTH) protein
MRIRFGECVLDRETWELLVDGRPVHLSPKGMRFLDLLLANRPKALPKEEIHKALWPDTFVSDGTLTSLLAEVRSAIGDGGRDPGFIRTVHRLGYAFSGPAEEIPEERPPQRLRLRFAYRLYTGPREIALVEGENILGRDPEASIFIDHVSVSRRHARVTVSGEGVSIEDLGSKNGTKVGGRLLSGPQPLADNDEIRLGSIPMTFRAFPLSGSTETGASRAGA